MVNQYKPLPPEEDIKELFIFYYSLGLNDPTIASHLQDHYDSELYGLSITSVKHLRRKWGLKSTRQQKHTLQSIEQDIREIWKRFPYRGAETIHKNLRQDKGIHAPRELIAKLLKAIEPNAVSERQHRHFKRKRFICAGVNTLWTQDQHDKWQSFGLRLHIGLDPFAGYILWLKVWWTNRNAKLIASYYLEAAQNLGAIPLVTQSDPGKENFGTANAHTTARHTMDPTLSDTIQHRWMRSKNNIKPEASWSLLRRDFTPGFENILDEGVNSGWYDVDNALKNLVFRWLAILWIQAELDDWVILQNWTAPRADRNKIIPHGIPDLIQIKPEHFNA